MNDQPLIMSLEKKAYKRAKKKKKLVWVLSDAEVSQTLTADSSVCIVKENGKGKLNRKVTEVLSYEDMMSFPEKEKKYIYPKETSIAEGAVGVRIRHRAAAARIGLLFLKCVIFILIFLAIIFSALSLWLGEGPFGYLRFLSDTGSRIVTASRQKEQTQQIVDKVNAINESSLSEEEKVQELLKVYQQDPDYGVSYICSVENGIFSCYITDSLIDDLIDDFNSEYSNWMETVAVDSEYDETAAMNAFVSLMMSMSEIHGRIINVFEKFGVQYEAEVLPGMDYVTILDGVYLDSEREDYYSLDIYNRGSEDDPQYSYDLDFGFDQGDGDWYSVGLPLTKLNLVDMSYDRADVYDYMTGSVYEDTDEHIGTYNGVPDDSEEEILRVNFFYVRPDGNYDGWNLWTWEWTVGDGGTATGFEENEEGNMCASLSIPAGTQIGYVIRKGDWEERDIDMDQFVDLSSYKSGTVDVWIDSGIEGCEVIPWDDVVMK